MTLNEILKIQSVLDKRAIAKDTLKTLNNTIYYSKSKGVNIAIGDMHIDHFLRAFKIENYQEKTSVEDQTQKVIEQQKQTLKKIQKVLEQEWK